MNNTSTGPRLAVTVGDPAGIGPEIVVRSLADRPTGERARLAAVGDIDVLMRAADVCGLDIEFVRVAEPAEAPTGPARIGVVDTGELETSPAFGRVDAAAGRAALAAIEAAAALALDGRADGLVTAPINKEAIWAAGAVDLGHTELLARITGSTRPATMFLVRGLKIFFATRHLSLRAAIDRLDQKVLAGAISDALQALAVLGHDSPRLAVAALNPHGGEGGEFGTEEIDDLAPAVATAREAGHDVVGPVPADSVFHQGLEGRYDGVLSLYHDQGHIAAKTADFDGTVSVTMGLPILRTSVDHGTAFDIAGTGTASHATMRAAIDAAVDLAAFAPRLAEVYATPISAARTPGRLRGDDPGH